MNLDQLRDHLCSVYPDLCPLFSVEFGDGVLNVASNDLFSAANDLKNLGFDRLLMLTAVDRGVVFEYQCRLLSRAMSAAITLKTEVPRERPSVSSLVPLWPAADWQEREVYDMFGISFAGHPDLRRILLPDDWGGYPLRKDYKDPRMIRRPDYI